LIFWFLGCVVIGFHGLIDSSARDATTTPKEHTMEQFETYFDQDGDGATTCNCRHCTSEGRYDQDNTCRYYARPAVEETPTINWSRRSVA